MCAVFIRVFKYFIYMGKKGVGETSTLYLGNETTTMCRLKQLLQKLLPCLICSGNVKLIRQPQLSPQKTTSTRL